MCLKRAFALLESRWKVDRMDRAEPPSDQEPVAFGKSLLPPDLFVSVMAFLDPHQAMRSGQPCKDWWRNGVFWMGFSLFTRTHRKIRLAQARSAPGTD